MGQGGFTGITSAHGGIEILNPYLHMICTKNFMTMDSPSLQLTATTQKALKESKNFMNSSQKSLMMMGTRHIEY